jgi:hypothetical protein
VGCSPGVPSTSVATQCQRANEPTSSSLPHVPCMLTSLEAENPALHVHAVSVAKEKFSLCKPAVQSANEITGPERLSLHGLGEITYQRLQDNITSLTSHGYTMRTFCKSKCLDGSALCLSILVQPKRPSTTRSDWARVLVAWKSAGEASASAGTRINP